MIPKFRCWDVENKKMFTNNELIIWNSNVYANDSGNLTVDKLKGWSVDDKFLMQSTGLKDKNGVEIFEGDVVTNSEDPELKFEIKLDVLTGIYSKVSDGDIQYLAASSEEEVEETREDFKEYLEVIGNIYENPELMEVTD